MSSAPNKTRYRAIYPDQSWIVEDDLRVAFARHLEAPDFALGSVDIVEDGPVLFRDPSKKSPCIVLGMEGSPTWFASGCVEQEFRWAQMDRVIDAILAAVDKAIDKGSRFPTSEFDTQYRLCNELVMRFMPDYAHLRDHFCNMAFAAPVNLERFAERLCKIRDDAPGRRYEVPLSENYAWSPYGGMILSKVELEQYNNLTRDICRRLGGSEGGVEYLRDRRHAYVRDCYEFRQAAGTEKSSRRASTADQGPSL